MNGFDPAVWVAQGFGSGRLKPGPGTWGSLVGVVWFVGLVATGSLWGFFGGILLSIPLCAWICGEAEKALGEKDPGSVVLDEIIAVPLCFSAWVLSQVHSTGQMPPVSYFFSGNHWLGSPPSSPRSASSISGNRGRCGKASRCPEAGA